MLSILLKIFKVLNSEQSPAQLAAAISMAMIIGITPMLSLHNLLVILLVLWFRINITLFIVFWPVFTLLGILLSPLADQIGASLLSSPSLAPMWESFYNTLLGRWSNFYYSGVLGSLVIAIVLAIVSFPLSRYLVEKYRHTWLEKMQKYHVVKLLKSSKLWQLYASQSS